MIRRISPWLVGFLALLVYGAWASGYFVSEDFLLVRFLIDHPPWADLRALISSPYLGVSIVKFWRPLSTMVLGLEGVIFGGNPVGYHVVNALLHAVNVLLVWAIARRLAGGERGDAGALAAALLFAVYPLHPNAVIWGASVATVLAATFLFGAVERYLRFRESGRMRDRAAALVLCAAGLASYETAATVPLAIAAFDHASIGRATVRRHAARVRGYLPFLGLLGVYFLVRRGVLGAFVGGYDDPAPGLAQAPWRLVRELALSIYQLHVPLYDRAPGVIAPAVVMVLLIALPVGFAPLINRKDPRALRGWLFGWIWQVACMAPFAFQASVPANGRYWYLPAAGCAIGLAALAAAGFRTMTSRAKMLAPAVVVVVGIVWTTALAQNLAAYREAAVTSRAIQQGLVEQADPATPNFLARYPYFVTNGRGVPIAQVFHYGVWDAVHAPFVDAPRDVYPLPQLDGAELVPVRLGAPASRIFVWDAVARRVREAAPLPAPPMPVELDVLTGGSPGIAVRTSPEMAARFRLIVVARGNAAVVELASDAVHDGVLRAALPEEFCRAMVQLYGDHEMFWWIEGRDAGGVVSAFTRLRAFRWSE